MIHHLRQVQGLEHKTVQVYEVQRLTQRLYCNLQAWLNCWAQGHKTDTTVNSNIKNNQGYYSRVIDCNFSRLSLQELHFPLDKAM